MKTVAVIEGFAGGPVHTRRFRRELSEAGFRVIKDRTQADILVAHSAGIYGIPGDVKASVLMLIGPTYWPGEKLIKRTFRHARSSGKYHLRKFGVLYYLRKKALEIYYFFRRHNYMWLGIMNNNKLGHLRMLIADGNRRVIIVRNTDDPYCTPQIQHKIKGPNVEYIELPGVHDDFISNPQPYIGLLLKFKKIEHL